MESRGPCTLHALVHQKARPGVGRNLTGLHIRTSAVCGVSGSPCTLYALVHQKARLGVGRNLTGLHNRTSAVCGVSGSPCTLYALVHQKARPGVCRNLTGLHIRTSAVCGVSGSPCPLHALVMHTSARKQDSGCVGTRPGSTPEQLATESRGACTQHALVRQEAWRVGDPDLFPHWDG